MCGYDDEGDPALERRIARWEDERNATGTTVDWQFTTGG